MPDDDAFPPFGQGVMTFAEWLQWVFLPNARSACRELDLPSSSEVGVYAVRELDGAPDAGRLAQLLSEFDRQVVRAQRGLRRKRR